MMTKHDRTLELSKHIQTAILMIRRSPMDLKKPEHELYILNSYDPEQESWVPEPTFLEPEQCASYGSELAFHGP